MNHDPQGAALLSPLDLDEASHEEASRVGWQHAGERILLYLKASGASPEEQLGLALEAMRRARSQRPGGAVPVVAALEALWDIMSERSKPAGLRYIGACDFALRSRRKGPPSSEAAMSRPCSELALPAMRRQCMTSAPMELAPWRNAAVRILAAVREPTEALLYRHGAPLGYFAALASFIFLK